MWIGIFVSALFQINCPPSMPGSVPQEVSVEVKENGECDFYFIDGPTLAPGDEPAPLLVLFHGQSLIQGTDQGSHDEHLANIYGSHDLISDAVARGWFVLMHDGGSIGYLPDLFATYGSERFQHATRAVLDHATSNFQIDPNRIYGYGFSMGGEEVLAYAARNLDPQQPGFAAIFLHSAYPSPIFQRLNGGGQLWGLNYGFPGGHVNYCADKFLWQKATVLDYVPEVVDVTTPGNICRFFNGPLNLLLSDVNFDTSQLHNLGYTPLESYHYDSEPVGVSIPNDLIQQFRDQESPNTSTNLTVLDDSGPPACVPAGTTTHSWPAVCSSFALDFFDDGITPKTRQQRWDTINTFPNLNTTLMAEDGVRYHYFRVQRTLPTDFARLRWIVRKSKNLLNIVNDDPAYNNISELTVEAGSDDFGVLDLTKAFRLRTHNAMTIRVRGYGLNPPTSLLRKTPGGLSGGLSIWPFTYDGVDEITWQAPAGTSTWTVQ